MRVIANFIIGADNWKTYMEANCDETQSNQIKTKSKTFNAYRPYYPVK